MSDLIMTSCFLLTTAYLFQLLPFHRIMRSCVKKGLGRQPWPPWAPSRVVCLYISFQLYSWTICKDFQKWRFSFHLSQWLPNFTSERFNQILQFKPLRTFCPLILDMENEQISPSAMFLDFLRLVFCSLIFSISLLHLSHHFILTYSF